MNIVDSHERVEKAIREEIAKRFGPKAYERILRGFLLDGLQTWFAPHIFGPGSESKKNRSTKGTPLSPLEMLDQIRETSLEYVRSPSVHVDCGFGPLTAALGIDEGLETQEGMVHMAQSLFPEISFRPGRLQDLEGKARYRTILSCLGLGPRAMRDRKNPVFHEFFEAAHRLLAPGGHLIVADRSQFQDNIIEPQVVLDYEIVDVTPIKGTGVTIIITLK